MGKRYEISFAEAAKRAAQGLSKPRSDVRKRLVDLLGEEGADGLAKMLCEGMTYREAQDWVGARTGWRPCTATLSNLYQAYMARKMGLPRPARMEGARGRRFAIVVDVFQDEVKATVVTRFPARISDPAKEDGGK